MRTARWVLVTYAAIIRAGIVAVLPNLFTPQQLAGLPSWFPKQQVMLGLDLRGGSHLVLEVDARALVQERLQDLVVQARRELRLAAIDPASIRRQNDAVTVMLKDPSRQADAIRVLQKLAISIGSLSFGGAGDGDLDITSGRSGQIRVSLTQEGVRDRINAAVEQSLEIIRHRIDQVGVAEPTIQRVGVDRILVQLPGVQDPARIRQLLGSTAKLTFHMLAPDDPAGPVPAGVRVLPGSEPGERYAIEDRVALSGERLSDARAGFDTYTNEPVVSFRFDSTGAREFAGITQANVGHPFAIVLDGKVLSAPIIREPSPAVRGRSAAISPSHRSPISPPFCEPAHFRRR